MHTCGIDIGSRSTKTIILDDNLTVVGRGLRSTGGKPVLAADEARQEALLAARIGPDSIDQTTATGYGRRLVPGDIMQFTTVTCHAAGAWHAFPNLRNVLDIGSHRSTTIRLDENGHVHRFRLNDRCGAGVGRFLERVAETLEVPLEEIGQLALFSRNPQLVPSVCSVLAETEILNHITNEEKSADILRGVFEALANRLSTLVRQVWVPGSEIFLTGGVARNAGMVRALEEALKTPIIIHHDSEFMGAIGAALLARESVDGSSPAGS